MQKLTYSKKWPKFILAQKYLQMCFFIFEFDACDIYTYRFFFSGNGYFFAIAMFGKVVNFFFLVTKSPSIWKFSYWLRKNVPSCFATQHCPSKKFSIHYICNVLNQKCAQPLLGNVRLWKCLEFWYLLCTKCAIKLYFSISKSVPNFQYMAPSWSKMANCAIGNM